MTSKSKSFLLGLVLCLMGIAIVFGRRQFSDSIGVAGVLASQAVAVICLILGGRFLYAGRAAE